WPLGRGAPTRTTRCPVDTNIRLLHDNRRWLWCGLRILPDLAVVLGLEPRRIRVPQRIVQRVAVGVVALPEQGLGDHGIRREEAVLTAVVDPAAHIDESILVVFVPGEADRG